MNRIRLSKYVAFTFLFAVLFKICFLNSPTGQSQEEEINLTQINVTEKSTASSSIAKPTLKYQVTIHYILCYKIKLNYVVDLELPSN